MAIQDTHVLGYIVKFQDGTSKFVPLFTGTIMQCCIGKALTCINNKAKIECTSMKQKQESEWDIKRIDEVPEEELKKLHDLSSPTVFDTVPMVF